MKTITVKNKTIKLYDSIDEMPITNFQKYNRYILLDVGLGSDVNSVDEHIANLAKLIKTDMVKAQRELQNLRQNMHLIVSNISPKYMAFAALIQSIDNKPLNDLSDDNLKEVLNNIKEVEHSTIASFLTRVKKKLEFELETYFPSEFCNAKEKEVYDKLKQRTLLMLQGIIEDKNTSEEIAKIDDFLFSLHNPKQFVGSTSVEIKYEKQFETSCMLISQKTGMTAKKMTVFEFYNTLTNIGKQAEAELKAHKKLKHK